MNRNVRRRVIEVPIMNRANETDRRMVRLHLDHVRRTGATRRTIFHRGENLRRLSEAIPCELLDATPDILEDWQSGLRVSLSSIATYTSHVRGFYVWAVASGHLEVDPSQRLPRPKVTAGLPRPIPAGDLELALECASDPEFTWIVLGAYMGLRSAEVAAIRREDVNEGIIEGKRRLFLSGVGKGEKPYKLPVPADVEPILARHLTTQLGPLWRTGSGAPVASRNVTNQVTALFRSLGQAHTMHCCRHTFGTEVYRNTRDMLVTQSLLRHASLETTRIYVQEIPAAGVAALDQRAAGLAKPARRAKSA